MNNADYVAQLIADRKAAGADPMRTAWEAALACVGWAYVFGARGELCTPANRRKYYASKGAEHPTIKSACKGFDSGNCSGCKWYPKEKRTRFFDCRGFPYWILLQVYGWKLMGSGATSQWNNKDNWKAQGEIATMPKDTLVCLFVKKGSSMSHTGFGWNSETVECSAGVQHFTSRNKKWTHWGVPACIGAEVKPAEPAEEPKDKTWPTIRKGNKNVYVKQMQQILDKLGYNLGICGVDSDFGTATEKALKEFQRDHQLEQDGVCGPQTWAALKEAEAKLSEKPAEERYTVTIKGLTKGQAEELCKTWKEATIKKE